MDVLDPEKLIETAGTVGLFLVIFAESGLLFGFFLPGDSLLFTAGFLSWRGDLPVLPLLLAGCFVAAVAGDQVGYVFGRRVGPALFRRPNSRFFKNEHVVKAQQYFEQYGPKTIVLARFVPVVRTFAPIVAGVGRMDYRTFVTFNVLGGLVWAVGVTSLGWLTGEILGKAIDVDKYLLPIVGVVVLLSVLPVLVEVRKHRRATAAAVDELRDAAEEIEELEELEELEDRP